jgi:hypothetical protein
LSPKSSASKLFKQSFAKLSVELKHKLEKDWEHEIAEAKKAALKAAKEDGREIPMEQIDLNALSRIN